MAELRKQMSFMIDQMIRSTGRTGDHIVFRLYAEDHENVPIFVYSDDLDWVYRLASIEWDVQNADDESLMFEITYTLKRDK